MDFVQYLVDKDNSDINPHFSPVIDSCQPCHVKYNFYTNLRSLSQDAAYTVHKIHVQPDYCRDMSLHTIQKFWHVQIEMR